MFYIPQVDKTTFSEEDDVTARGHSESINLGFDVGNGGGISFQPGNVNLDIEMANANSPPSVTKHDKTVKLHTWTQWHPRASPRNVCQ